MTNVIDSTRIAELKLAVGMANFNDSLDLMNWATGAVNPRYSVLLDAFPMQGNATVQGLTFTLAATGKASTTGEAPMQMDITIPILIADDTDPGTATGAGDPVIAAEQAILAKIRQIKRGAGAYALNTAVYLAFRIIASSHFTYWACFDAEWQPALLRQASDIKRFGILTLHCFPYSIGDPITDAVSTVLTPATPQFYRAAIPGDVRALTRLWVTDLSGNSLIGQRLTLYSRSLDSMTASDWTATYAATPLSPGAVNTSTPAGALGGTYARLTTSGVWQTLSSISSGAGAFQSMTDADVLLKLRDAAAPPGAPTGVTVSSAANAGFLGSGTYSGFIVGKDGSGHRSALTALVPITITNLTTSGVGVAAMTIFMYDDLETGQLLNWNPGATSNGNNIVVNGTAKYAGSYGIQMTGGSGQSPTVLSKVAPAPTSTKSYSFQARINVHTANTGANSPSSPGSALQSIRMWAAVNFGSSAEYYVGFGSVDGVNYGACYMTGYPGVPAGTAAAVIQAGATTTLSAGFHLVEITVEDDGSDLGVRVAIDGVNYGGVSTIALLILTSSTPRVDAFGFCAQNSEVLYIDNVGLADGYIGGVGISGGSAITWNWTAGLNDTDYVLYLQMNGTIPWYSIDAGNVATYTWTNLLASGTTLVAAPPTGAAPVQPTEVRVGYGTAATDLEYTQPVQMQLSNGKWEMALADTIPLPPDEIPEGMTASPWTLQVQARNLGVTTPTIDHDETFTIPHDGDSVTLTAPSTLSGPAVWMVDDRRDHRVSVRLYATGKVTAAGNEVTDTTRAAATLDDGIAVPGGYGIYPSGTVLTHGTVGGAPRLRVTASGLMTGTTGWFAAAYIPENTASGRRIFSWSSGSAAEIIECFYTGSAFELIRQHSTTGANITATQALVIGTPVVVMGYWTATTLGLSVNGSAFVTVGNTNIPSGLGSAFDIGTRASIGSGSTDLYGAVQWFACGTGTPVVADAAIVSTRGTTSPTPDDFTNAAAVQMIWAARQTPYWTSTVLGGADVAGEFSIGPANAIVAAYFEYSDGSGNLIADQQYQAMTIQNVLRPRYGLARGAS